MTSAPPSRVRPSGRAGVFPSSPKKSNRPSRGGHRAVSPLATAESPSGIEATQGIVGGTAGGAFLVQGGQADDHRVFGADLRASQRPSQRLDLGVCQGAGLVRHVVRDDLGHPLRPGLRALVGVDVQHHGDAGQKHGDEGRQLHGGARTGVARQSLPLPAGLSSAKAGRKRGPDQRTGEAKGSGHDHGVLPAPARTPPGKIRGLRVVVMACLPRPGRCARTRRRRAAPWRPSSNREPRSRTRGRGTGCARSARPSRISGRGRRHCPLRPPPHRYGAWGGSAASADGEA